MIHLFADNSFAPAPAATERWSFTYLTGEAEEGLGTDLFVADAPMPGEGSHPVAIMAHGEEVPAVAFIWNPANGMPRMGVVALASDVDAIVRATTAFTAKTDRF